MTNTVKKFVWDTSAIVNIKEPDKNGYSPGHSLIKDLADGWIQGPYLNIFPTLAVFEVSATVSRKHREEQKILRKFYLRDKNATMYEIDEDLISRSAELVSKPGFDKLCGADLVFACIAFVESAYLVTLDKSFAKNISQFVEVIDLNESRAKPLYREKFEV